LTFDLLISWSMHSKRLPWLICLVSTKAGIPRRLHRHGHRTPPEDPRRHVRHARSTNWSYSCGKLNGKVTRHADILADILARIVARMSVSVSWNAAPTSTSSRILARRSRVSDVRMYIGMSGESARRVGFCVGVGAVECKLNFGVDSSSCFSFTSRTDPLR